ncbi:MAG TPA: PD-(D/E)XK nuclease family protein, partial [bacterium]
HGAPLLAGALGRWRGAWDALPRPPQAPSAWAVACDGLLRALGWPGQRTPDSAEFQTREKWHGVLEELARLDPVLPPLPHGEALALLRRLAGEAEFQPQGAEAPVQVLGVLESGGLEFDHLWVLGLHEELWPPAPRPNPFLPLELQRRHGMPRASVARELEIARRETARLLQSAPDVVFSHAAWDGDRPLRPSPLIRAVPWAAPDTLPPAPGAAGLTLREAIGAPLPAPEGLEALRDDAAPPVAGDGPVPGGTGVFTDQAACPFRAFARHRLHARAPERPEPGLDAAERGTLVHGVLERAWRRIRDHATLHALDAEALGAVLDEAVEATLAHFAESHRDRLGPRLRALERRRLLGLARDWMALERERAPFAVELMEDPQPLEIGGISVRGRVDRIDRLADGARVLIDYKTGDTRLSAWWGERPDEPQLPLYAASGGLPLAGVAFAQVRRQELTFRGVADDPARFPRAERFDKVRLPPGTAPYASWAAVVEHWRAALERLAAA